MVANDPGQPALSPGLGGAQEADAAALAPTATVDLEVPASVLAVGAHPDDIEFGCGGTLAKWADAGCVVHHLVCTDGSKGTWDPDTDTVALVGRREEEQREAARRLAGDRRGDVIFRGRVDGELENDAATRSEIVRAIRRLRPEIVLGAFLGGLLLKATSQADVRQWEMLPRTVYVLPLQVPPGTHDVSVEFPHVPGVRQEWRGLVVPAEGEATYYFRMQRGNPGPFQWPPLGFAGAAPTAAPTTDRSQ